MRRGVACGLIVLLLALAHPIEARLRAEAPPVPASARLGVGPLLGSVLTGAFRPLLLTYLWIRTDTLYGQSRYDELHQNIRTMLALYPNNNRAREFLGWNLAFNMKVEAPNRTLAWRWARDGLDILGEIDEGTPTLAYWLLVQCGQNPAHPFFPMRYAGDDWELEKRFWRPRVEAWGEQKYGAKSTRFELGLRVLEGRDGFLDTRRRADLAICLAYDDFVRLGRSPHFDDVILALRTYTQAVADNPALARLLQGEMYLLQWLQARDLDKLEEAGLSYRPAAALWVIGALDESMDQAKRMRCLELAFRGFEQVDRDVNPDKEDLGEEKALVRMWMEHVIDPTEKPPPLPFD